jgi:hypothetical protein
MYPSELRRPNPGGNRRRPKNRSSTTMPLGIWRIPRLYRIRANRSRSSWVKVGSPWPRTYNGVTRAGPCFLPASTVSNLKLTPSFLNATAEVTILTQDAGWTLRLPPRANTVGPRSTFTYTLILPCRAIRLAMARRSRFCRILRAFSSFGVLTPTGRPDGATWPCPTSGTPNNMATKAQPANRPFLLDIQPPGQLFIPEILEWTQQNPIRFYSDHPALPVISNMM